MRITKFLLSAVVLATSLFSCSDDKEYTYEESKSVVLTAQIAQNSPKMSRAAETVWAANDAIGVFMKKGTGLSNVVEGASNKHFTTPLGDGEFWNKTAGDAIFYPKDGSTVDFISYYPYSATLASNIYKIDVTNQTKQEEIDLMYSENATDLKNGDKPALEFAHQLTKVVFEIEGVNGVLNLDGLKVQITEMNTKADFNLGDKALTPEATKATLDMKTVIDPVNALKAVSEGIVIPTAAAARKFLFTIKISGVEKQFEWDASTQPFAAGTKNTYPVQLDAKLGAIVQPGATIKPWENGSSENIIIDLGEGGETPVGDGSQANPFSVEDAALKVGENAKWVTGYIVGSTNVARAIGTPSKDNIILATVAGETNEAKWIIIDIKDSPVAANLDIVTNSDLIGTKVKVQGNIVNTLFGNVLSMTGITAQEGGKDVTPPDPEGNLLFAGSDFNDWTAFLGGLNEFGLKAGYTAQSATGGREGSSALELKGTPAGNDYVFTAVHKSAFTASPTKISFYIKGTAAKSLSLNVYISDKSFKAYNLEDCSSAKTLEVAPNNQYTGTINTGGQWVKITLNIAGLDLQKAVGESVFALKVGKSSAYDLLVDDITFE